MLLLRSTNHLYNFDRWQWGRRGGRDSENYVGGEEINPNELEEQIHSGQKALDFCPAGYG